MPDSISVNALLGHDVGSAPLQPQLVVPPVLFRMKKIRLVAEVHKAEPEMGLGAASPPRHEEDWLAAPISGYGLTLAPRKLAIE